MAKTTTDAGELVTEYTRIWNEQEFSKLPDFVAESYTFISPVAGTVEGRENLKAYAAEIVRGFSNFRITIQEMVVGERLVMTESTLSGTHDGEYDGISPTHETVEVPEMATFVVEGGKLQEERRYFDTRDFFEQLEPIEE